MLNTLGISIAKISRTVINLLVGVFTTESDVDFTTEDGINFVTEDQ